MVESIEPGYTYSAKPGFALCPILYFKNTALYLHCVSLLSKWNSWFNKWGNKHYFKLTVSWQYPQPGIYSTREQQDLVNKLIGTCFGQMWCTAWIIGVNQGEVGEKLGILMMSCGPWRIFIGRDTKFKSLQRWTNSFRGLYYSLTAIMWVCFYGILTTRQLRSLCLG